MKKAIILFSLAIVLIFGAFYYKNYCLVEDAVVTEECPGVCTPEIEEPKVEEPKIEPKKEIAPEPKKVEPKKEDKKLKERKHLFPNLFDRKP